jgi:hypothetical protein
VSGSRSTKEEATATDHRKHNKNLDSVMVAAEVERL